MAYNCRGQKENSVGGTGEHGAFLYDEETYFVRLPNGKEAGPFCGACAEDYLDYEGGEIISAYDVEPDEVLENAGDEVDPEPAPPPSPAGPR